MCLEKPVFSAFPYGASPTAVSASGTPSRIILLRLLGFEPRNMENKHM